MATIHAKAGNAAGADAAIEEAQALERPDWPLRLRMCHTDDQRRVAKYLGRMEASLTLSRQYLQMRQDAGAGTVPALSGLADTELAAGQAEAAVRTGLALVAQLEGTREEQELAHARLNLCAAFLSLDQLQPARRTAVLGWKMAERFGMQAWWADYLALLAALDGRPQAAALAAGLCRRHLRTHAGPPRTQRSRGGRPCAPATGHEPARRRHPGTAGCGRPAARGCRCRTGAGAERSMTPGPVRAPRGGRTGLGSMLSGRCSSAAGRVPMTTLVIEICARAPESVLLPSVHPPLCGHHLVINFHLLLARWQRDEMPRSCLSLPSGNGRSEPPTSGSYPALSLHRSRRCRSLQVAGNRSDSGRLQIRQTMFLESKASDQTCSVPAGGWRIRSGRTSQGGPTSLIPTDQM